MVRGLATYKNHFAEFSDQYVLIGGAAAAELMEKAGLRFRTTKDLDVVLFVEALTPDFFRAFWDFIEKGKYGGRYQSRTERKYYRFDKPKDEIYPECIELFSRIPDSIQFEGHGRITPIPVDDGLSSLSAILLDDDYYPLIVNGRTDVYGLSCLKVEYMILLKAKAWLDMMGRRNSGVRVDQSNINKHRNDVFRLYRLLEPNLRIIIPESIQTDLSGFLSALESENIIDLKAFEIRQKSLAELIQDLRQIYGLHT